VRSSSRGDRSREPSSGGVCLSVHALTLARISPKLLGQMHHAFQCFCLGLTLLLSTEASAQRRTREVGRFGLGGDGPVTLVVSATNQGMILAVLGTSAANGAAILDPDEIPAWIDSAGAILSSRPERKARESILYEARNGDMVLQRLLDDAGDHMELVIGSDLASARTRVTGAQMRALMDTLRVAVQATREMTPPRAVAESEAERRSSADSVVATLPAYLDNIVRQIRLRFQPGRGSARADAMFLIRTDGSMTGFRFVRRSGSFAFDLEAQGAVSSAATAFGRPLRMTSEPGVTVALTFRTDPSTGPSVTLTDSPSTEATAGDHVYFEFQVEKRVAPMSGNPRMRYPDMLRSANIEGEVLVQFVVDTTGRVDIATFKVLMSSHDMFSQSVRELVRASRFYPAEIAGRRVKQLVQQPFNFTLPR
jgi:TonB family protein